MKKSIKMMSLFVAVLSLGITSCSKDDNVKEPEAESKIENVEIGSGNNGKGVIGRDFHLDMDVTAATRINSVQVSIEQRPGETYTKSWSFDITWDEFKGAKNTNVHKHFDIDKEAPEGVYDFIIRIVDENGTVIEETHSIELISLENLPVNPELYSLMLEKLGKGYLYILNRGFMIPGDKGYGEGDTLRSTVDIRNVKGDGVLYTVLIKKSAGHLPETAEDIDFSKVIVTDMREHKNMAELDYFTNYLALEGQVDHMPKELLIGGTTDNNSPDPNIIQGDKVWENGAYYFGVIYTNTTYNMSAHYYIELDITGF
ncbi:DUF4625 domain-containing protein [Olivibacter sp. CPCC 100613]|uniref:DUF4625 domain-containing protein n=1 Tax=Olivibacter sp. CPCC 100613 TaxID=3079931 RepID=UPI002FFCCC6E